MNQISSNPVENEQTPTPSYPRGRKLTWRKKLAFTVFVLALAVLSVESLLILSGKGYPLLYSPDENCATRLKPNLNVRYSEEGSAVVRTNSQGFRDVERNQTRREGSFRIALVGDSFCEAIQVDRSKSIAGILEQRLNESYAPVEVLNFGVSGFGTAQELRMLQEYVLEYEPDLIVLGMFLGNDIVDNSRTLNPGQLKPYYDLVEGKLKLDNSFRDDPQFRAAGSFSTRAKAALINSSRVLQIFNRIYSRWKAAPTQRPNVGIGKDPNLYRPPATQAWVDAWEVTEALIKEFYSCCEQAGADCLVLTLSTPIQVHPDFDVREEFRRQNELRDLFYPDNRVNQFCQKNGIPVLSIAPQMAQESAGTEPPLFFHGFRNTELGTGHWNVDGHQRAAELLEKYLLSQMLP